nr:hypothetical protein [Tanacetum cinerariifolium]
MRRENTRSHSDLDMWNHLAPYVLRLFGRFWGERGDRGEGDSQLYRVDPLSPTLFSNGRSGSGGAMKREVT